MGGIKLSQQKLQNPTKDTKVSFVTYIIFQQSLYILPLVVYKYEGKKQYTPSNTEYHS